MNPYEPVEEIVLECVCCHRDIYPERDELFIEMNGKNYCNVCLNTIYIQNRIDLNKQMKEARNER